MTGRPKRAKEDKERHLADMNAIEEEYALLKTRSETPPRLSLSSRLVFFSCDHM